VFPKLTTLRERARFEPVFHETDSRTYNGVFAGIEIGRALDQFIGVAMPTPPRRWFAFRLRTLFVAVVVVSIPIAWVANTLNWIRRRQDAIGLGHLGILNETPSMTERWCAKPKPFNFTIANKLLGMYPSRNLCRGKDSPLTREQAEALFPEATIEDFD
jgi:hypothetical protein